jgi:hypothetical protein
MQVEKWKRWMAIDPDWTQDKPMPIWHQIAEMEAHRYHYRSVVRVAQESDLPGSSFWGTSTRCTYTHTQAAGIRRQVDTHRDVQSLGRLL